MWHKALPLLFLLLAACGERVQNPPQAGTTISVPAFEWRIVDQSSLEQVYTNSGMNLSSDRKLYGFAGKTDKGVFVIYTTAPTTVDDEVTTTLGHEVLHLVLGEYHL